MSRYVNLHFTQHAVRCKPIWFLHHNCLNLPWLASNTRLVQIHVAIASSNRQAHAILQSSRSPGGSRFGLECWGPDRPLLPHHPWRNRCACSIGAGRKDTSADDQGSVRLRFRTDSPWALQGSNSRHSVFKSDDWRASGDVAQVLRFAFHSRESWKRKHLRTSGSRHSGQGTRDPLPRNPYSSPLANHRRHSGLMASAVCRVPCAECQSLPGVAAERRTRVEGSANLDLEVPLDLHCATPIDQS